MRIYNKKSISPSGIEYGLKPKLFFLSKYGKAILGRTLFTFFVPIFVWLILETFFK